MEIISNKLNNYLKKGLIEILILFFLKDYFKIFIIKLVIFKYLMNLDGGGL